LHEPMIARAEPEKIAQHSQPVRNLRRWVNWCHWL